jgi:hypothetical protein
MHASHSFILIHSLIQRARALTRSRNHIIYINAHDKNVRVYCARVKQVDALSEEPSRKSRARELESAHI